MVVRCEALSRDLHEKLHIIRLCYDCSSLDHCFVSEDAYLAISKKA
jgi:hypothetical protein